MRLVRLMVRRVAGLLHSLAAFLLEATTGVSLVWGRGESRGKWSLPGLHAGCVLRERVLFVKRGGSVEGHIFKEDGHATVHAGYENADILRRNNVTLMALTPERAIFCVAPEGVNVYNAGVSSFIYV